MGRDSRGPRGLGRHEKSEDEQKQEDQATEEKLQRARREEETAGVDEIDASLEVKPGIFLPDGFGMFAVAERKVLPMKQDTAVSKLDAGRAVERTVAGIPAIPSKWHVSVPGKRQISVFPPESLNSGCGRKISANRTWCSCKRR